MEGTSPYLFPNRVGKQLEEKQLRRMLGKHKIAAVPHGFRSSFRDWGGRGRRIIRARSSKRPWRTCGPEQGRGSLQALGPVRAPTEADGRLGGLSGWRDSRSEGRTDPLIHMCSLTGQTRPLSASRVTVRAPLSTRCWMFRPKAGRVSVLDGGWRRKSGRAMKTGQRGENVRPRRREFWKTV